MSPGDDATPDRSQASLDQLRHDLKTPLTAIHGRTQLLARSVRRSPSLTAEERMRMLEDLTTIEATVRAMVMMIDDLGGTGGDSGDSG